MQAGVGLLDTDMMPIFIIIALDIVITLRFSINCSTLICLPTVLFAFKTEASSETYAPPGLFSIIYFQIYKPKNPKIPLLQFIYFYFVLRFSNLLYLSLSDLTFASDRKGLTTPLSY